MTSIASSLRDFPAALGNSIRRLNFQRQLRRSVRESIASFTRVLKFVASTSVARERAVLRDKFAGKFAREMWKIGSREADRSRRGYWCEMKVCIFREDNDCSPTVSNARGVSQTCRVYWKNSSFTLELTL